MIACAPAPEVRLVSEDTLLVRFGDRIDPTLPALILTLREDLARHFGSRVRDLVPSYTTLMCVFGPGPANLATLQAQVEERARLVARQGPQTSGGQRRQHRLPVCYDPELAPDLESHAARCGLSTDTLMQLHCARTYQVFAIGFSPGFGFLGEVDQRIAGPRHDVPRTRVPAGSVGIAGRQTAVYPKASPGGWQIIGRCPATLFDPDNLSLLAVGDQVRFYPVCRREFLDLGGAMDQPGAESAP